MANWSLGEKQPPRIARTGFSILNQAKITAPYTGIHFTMEKFIPKNTLWKLVILAQKPPILR
jgi:hypothetical protein